jgi:hypothetical protein
MMREKGKNLPFDGSMVQSRISIRTLKIGRGYESSLPGGEGRCFRE